MQEASEHVKGADTAQDSTNQQTEAIESQIPERIVSEERASAGHGSPSQGLAGGPESLDTGDKYDEAGAHGDSMGETAGDEAEVRWCLLSLIETCVLEWYRVFRLSSLPIARACSTTFCLLLVICFCQRLQSM